MAATKVTVAILKNLDPISFLPDAWLKELAELCTIETVPRAEDPFHQHPIAGQSIYVVHGELALSYAQGSSEVIVGGAVEARYPVGKRREFISAKAVTEVQLIRVDDELLDILLTWDQAVACEPRGDETAAERVAPSPNWTSMSGLFGISSLRFGAFSRLHPAHIDELLRRFQRVEVKAGDVIISQGAEGDFYYLVEAGRCRVERMTGGVRRKLAELKSGDTFGEEALVSQAQRNATVTMITDGGLLRLSKQDFDSLLREPLLHTVSMEQARLKAMSGAQWIDVRYPSEYQCDHLPGARNIPLSEIRDALGALDMNDEYIVYCQSGRRSAAAAFLLAQRGYRALLLEGGLWGGDRLP